MKKRVVLGVFVFCLGMTSLDTAIRTDRDVEKRGDQPLPWKCQLFLGNLRLCGLSIECHTKI
jgi:hypothetical protein